VDETVDVREVRLIFDIQHSIFDKFTPRTVRVKRNRHYCGNTNCWGHNIPADHDRRHISTSGTAKNAASLLRLESMGNRVDRCRLVVRAIRDFTTETQTAGDKHSSRPRPTPYFHFRYREKRRQFVTA